MKTAFRSLFGFRPFLWLWILALAAIYAATFWEGPISYDDGGLGTASFLVYYTVGLPFVLVVRFMGWPLGLLFGSSVYWGLDWLWMRWLRNGRDERRGRPASPSS